MNQWETNEEIVVPRVMMNSGVWSVSVPFMEKPANREFEQVNMIVNRRYDPDGESQFMPRFLLFVAILVCIIGT